MPLYAGTWKEPQKYPNGLKVPEYTVIRGGKCVATHTSINQSTGLPETRSYKYPLHYMEVGDYFIIDRQDNSNPTYESLRVHLHNRSVKMGKKFSVRGTVFPTLKVERIK
jgi:hypothetical protein